jgi:hypothetical protein
MFLCSSLRGEPVSPEQALKAAGGFLKGRTLAPGQSPRALSAAAGRTADEIQTVRSEDGTVLAYVVSLEPHGFVVTSANTDITPVVAYSLRGSFNVAADRLGPLYALLTADMKARANAVARQGGTEAADNNSTWSVYSSGETAAQAVQQWPPVNATTTGGWVETTWHQLPPYNALCPLDPVDGQRSVVGCAATAMAQLLNYHRWCGATFGSGDAYMTYSGVSIDADSTRYSFPSFPQLNDLLAALRLKYSQQLPLNDSDAAVLSLACGFSAMMDYSSIGSGAYPEDVVSALLGKFGLQTADLTGGLSSQSIQVLQENIINGLPALIGIRTADGMVGHVIVCDGYNTNGEYHLNFGWTSSQPAPITDAWYSLPSGIPTDLSAISEAIVNIQAVPPSIKIDPSRLDFVSKADQRGQVKTLFVRNNTAEPIHIDSISCPTGFTVSIGDSNSYSQRLGPLDIQHSGQEVAVNVKFEPQTPGGYYGTLAVDYSGGKVKYAILDGESHAGGTEITDSNVSGTWSASHSPYYILGDIQVNKGDRLTIEPGVQVVFMGHHSLTVGASATLVAQGTAAQPIRFTAANTELGFAGLRLVQTGDDDVLSYCVITYAKKGVGPIGTNYGIRDLSGGALYLYDCSPTITHCILANNIGDGGGAIYCNSSDAVISNTVIANNACMGGNPQAGGIYCTGNSGVQIDNCTIVNNSPGGVLSDALLDTEVTNTILWGNSDYQLLALESVAAISYCDVQDGYPGEGNIDADPAFFNPTPGIGPGYDGAAANWTLKSTSPCINGGGQTVYADEDLAGNPRTYSNVADIGAYENQSDLALMTIAPAGRLDAGFVRTDTPGTATVNIANTGKRNLTITTVDVGYDREGVFSVTHPVTGKVLAPGESVQVEIGFAPRSEKAFTGVLNVYSTADNAAHRQVILSGVGTTGTAVSGAVSGTWTKAKSPYTVIGDISITRSKALTIEPGVVVRFAGPFSFTAGYRATLKAVGTEQDPIVFTATNKTEGWLGVRFVNAGNDDVLRNCTLEYANKPYTGASDSAALWGGAIVCCQGTDASSGSPTPSSPTIDHCTISHCYALFGGGICCIDASKAIISNNVIADNTAGSYGGALFIYNEASPSITNNVIAYNTAYIGGGIYNYAAIPAIVNNTIAHNRGAGMYLDSSYYYFFGTQNCSIENNIVWENEIYMEDYVGLDEYTIRYNDIQGGWTGQGNIDADPLFADSANRDYHLKSQAGRWDPKTGSWVIDSVTSPCIDAGDPTSAVGSEAAPNGGRIDMGAYGGTAQASKSH